MARIDPRLRAWGWLTRRMTKGLMQDEAKLIATQGRSAPPGRVTNWIFGTAPSGVDLSDRTVPGPGREIPVRVYRPAGRREGRPLVCYFHGGGFVFGALDMGNWLCGTVADRVGAVVVSVDYRLAPTHRFPAAVEDSYAALAWAAEHAAELGAGGPVGVMGESAGGTLAAVTCLLAAERGGPALSHQALIYPATDLTEARERAAVSPDAPFLSATDMGTYRRLYLGADGDPANPWASPLLAAGHAGLPPALIQIGEHDPLRTDGLRYAAALRAAGVPVRLTDYPGAPHGFMNFPGLSKAAHQGVTEVCAEQSAAFAAAAAVRETSARENMEG